MGKRTNTAVWLEKYSRWQIKVQKDGERKTFTSSTPGRNGQREANAKADAWLDDGIITTATRVSALIEMYLEAVNLSSSKTNHKCEKSRCDTWLIPNIGHLKISTLNDGHLQHIINLAYSMGRSKKTLMGIRATLMAFVKFCRKQKVTTYHPEDVAIPKGARVAQKRILQPDALQILFSVDTTLLRGNRIFDDYIYAYRLEVLTGFRPGEVFGLRPEDIFSNVIKLCRSWNSYDEITTGKNENAIRPFAMNTMVRKVVDAQLAIRTDPEYLFDRIKLDGYRKRWQRYCKSNDIPPISPYELRHTFVSIAKILPEGQVKALVGHSTNMDTFGVYGHEFSDELAQTSAQLEKIFKGITTTKKPLPEPIKRA